MGATVTGDNLDWTDEEIAALAEVTDLSIAVAMADSSDYPDLLPFLNAIIGEPDESDGN